MSVGKRDYFSRLQTLLVFLVLNGMAKTKLAVLPFFCCGEIGKNSSGNPDLDVKNNRLPIATFYSMHKLYTKLPPHVIICYFTGLRIYLMYNKFIAICIKIFFYFSEPMNGKH